MHPNWVCGVARACLGLTRADRESFLGSRPPCPAAPYTNVLDCVRATLRTSGARGPFQGLSATLLRNAPANSVYLGSFEARFWCRSATAGRVVGCPPASSLYSLLASTGSLRCPHR